MSQLFVDDVVSKEGTNSVGFSKGINVSVASTFSGAVTIGGTLTYEDVTNVEATGIITAKSGIKLGAAGIGGTFNANGDVTLAGVVTATSFSGAATGLTGVPGGQITGALAAVDGSALTGMANTANVSTSDLMVIGVGTFFGNRVLIQNTSGPVLELATNTGSNDSSIHLHEGAVGSTNNGGAVIYSGSNNKLSICCGTTLTTERIGIARDSGEVNIGSGVTISSAGVSTFSSDVNVGSAVTVYASAGIVSATSFSGDGSNLSGISAGAWTPIVSGLVDSGGEYEIIGTTSTLTSSYQMYRLTFYTEQTPASGESGLQLQIYNGAWREDTNYGYGWISNGGSVDSQTSAKGILLGKMGRRFEGVVQFSNPSQTTRPKWFSARAASMNSDDGWSEPLNFQVSGQYNGGTKNNAVTGIRLRSIDSSPAGGEGGGQNFSAGYYLLEGAAIS